jgi:regulator of ribonuclease activity A
MVVDGGASLERALFGDKLGALLLENGWAGIVINGAVRDVEFLRQMPIAVRALGICPTQPNKLGTGERDVIVTFAGTNFSPGDWLYADENGIILSATALD